MGLALMASPAQGQLPGLGMSLVPKVGFYSPATDLQAAADAAGELVDDRGGSLAFGLAADFGVPLSPLNVRVGFDYVTASEFTWADTSGVELEEATGEQTMLALTGDVILRPIPKLLILQPYLLAGAGVKRYDFSFQDAADDNNVEQAFPESETDFTLHAGIGVDVGIGPIALVAELSDYVSWYEAEGGDGSEMQNDLFLMAGLRIGLF
jgi:hypothetical protein